MRTFYAFEAIRGTWSVRELKRQIDSQYYQRCGWSKDPHKYAAMVQGKVEKLNADDFIKTNTVLEFLGAKLPPGWKEKEPMVSQMRLPEISVPMTGSRGESKSAKPTIMSVYL